MAETLYLGINAALVLVVLASLFCWARTLYRWHRRGFSRFLSGLVPARRQQRPFWSPAESLIMFGIWVLLMQVVLITAVRKGVTLRTEPAAVVAESVGEEVPDSVLTVEGLLVTILADSVGKIAAVVVVLAWLTLFARSAWRRIGLAPSADQIWFGLKAALYILPPTMLIGAASAYFVEEYEHPILQSLAEQPSPIVFAVIFFGTAVVTPIYEELMVRGCLQGGLQGWADRDGASAPRWRPRAWWPLVATSLLFGAMHLNHGAAAIPLFFLSLGVGYLYRQTGSLIAPIVVHMVLNGTTIVAEFVRLQSEMLN